MDEGLLSLDGYHVLGVYHPEEAYDYNQAESYLKQHNLRIFQSQGHPGYLGTRQCVCQTIRATAQFRQLVQGSQGALFMGGPDIPPALYKEPVHLLTSVTDPYRHYVEISYLFHLLGGIRMQPGNPFWKTIVNYLISGICLGMQSMNVATGGTMVQDIPTEMYGTMEC